MLFIYTINRDIYQKERFIHYVAEYIVMLYYVISFQAALKDMHKKTESYDYSVWLRRC